MRRFIVLAVLVSGSVAVAQESPWSGSVGIAVSGRDVHGSETSFRSQTDLRGGFSLDELTLQRGTTFTLRASGFGNAEPVSRARAEIRFHAPLTLSLSYDRRESFFALADPNLNARHDDWNLARWNVRAAWDGWRAGKLTVDLRRTSRGGSVLRPFLALNDVYPLRVGLNETMNEASVRFDTRAFPVQLSLEQSFARHDRRDRLAPGGENSISGVDPDVLLAAVNSGNDRQNIPTSRVIATYGSSNFEGTTTFRWTPSRLTARTPLTTTFGINGGTAGQVSFIDTVAGSATRDVFAGNGRFAVRLAPRWVVRLSTDYRNSSTNATLLGQRLLQMTNPQGFEADLSAPLTAQNIFDFTDATERLELERAGEHFTLRAGALASQRKVNDVDRRSTGGTVSAGWRSARFSTSADFEHGSFQHFIFRNDPETVDRLRVRVGVPIRAGWSVQGEGHFERGENPQRIAALSHRSNSGTLDLSWAPAVRDASVGLSVGATKLRTRTDLVLPGNTPGVSLYDLSLLTTTAHARFAPGRFAFTGAVTRTRDNGSTWPVGTWNANIRATMQGPRHTEFGVFGEHWSYNERFASLDDFNVNRYGVVLIWRFQ